MSLSPKSYEDFVDEYGGLKGWETVLSIPINQRPEEAEWERQQALLPKRRRERVWHGKGLSFPVPKGASGYWDPPAEDILSAGYGKLYPGRSELRKQNPKAPLFENYNYDPMGVYMEPVYNTTIKEKYPVPTFIVHPGEKRENQTYIESMQAQEKMDDLQIIAERAKKTNSDINKMTERYKKQDKPRPQTQGPGFHGGLVDNTKVLESVAKKEDAIEQLKKLGFTYDEAEEFFLESVKQKWLKESRKK